MLKLTMNPRKRSKRVRSFNSQMRHLMNEMMETDCKIAEDKSMLGDNLQALLRQEESGNYACVDYLSMTVWQHNVYELMKKYQHQTRNRMADSRIDEYCREQIVEWSFRVVDYFRIDREVVAMSLSFLDRFLATCQCDRSTFKLAATTTLHLAVKLLHPCKLGDLGILSDLSRGEFDMKDVAEMEAHVLRTLGWHLHPPTVVSFATLLLDYIFCDRSLNLTSADIDDLYDITSFFSELSVCDYYFTQMKPSAVALACIMNALEGMFGQDNSWSHHVMAYGQQMNFQTNVDFTAASQRLWELYERSEECALHNNFDSHEEEKVCGSGVFVKQTHSPSTSPITVTSKTLPADEYCAMRSKSIQNGSW